MRVGLAASIIAAQIEKPQVITTLSACEPYDRSTPIRRKRQMSIRGRLANRSQRLAGPIEPGEFGIADHFIRRHRPAKRRHAQHRLGTADDWQAEALAPVERAGQYAREAPRGRIVLELRQNHLGGERRVVAERQRRLIDRDLESAVRRERGAHQSQGESRGKGCAGRQQRGAGRHSEAEQEQP